MKAPHDITPVSGGCELEPPPTVRSRGHDPGAPWPQDVRFSNRLAWVLIVVFGVMITLPGVWREFSQDSVRDAVAGIFRPEAGLVVGRLRAVEKRIDEAVWLLPVRERMQSGLSGLFHEGNRKVIMGRDGWFFHRPGVRALTGRGPVLGPTHSVAKDPALKEWEGQIAVIKSFAAQLKERGIRLVLVPVPDKAGMRPQFLGGRPGLGTGPGRVRHPEAARFLASLRTEMEIVDLQDDIPFLVQDTHWESSGARMAAARVAAHIRGDDWAMPTAVAEPVLVDRGDLAGLLSVGRDRQVSLRTTARVAVTAPLEASAAASTVLLGDSNVNMYDEEGLPFHQAGAGFGSWLSACLGEPLHVIAMNGGGATQVRQRLAALPDDVVRSKKVVIWVLAERDLFMDPAVARENGVTWERVVFNTAEAKAGAAPVARAVVVEATLKACSEVLDMNSVNYPDAVFTAEFTVDRVLDGDYAEKEAYVVMWNFRNRVVQPAARLKPGQKVRLTLTPWLDQGAHTKVNLTDDFLRFDVPLLYAEQLEIVRP